MRIARVLAVLAVLAFVVGLTATFVYTYRDQTRRADRLERSRDATAAENRRLAAALASANGALATLTAGLSSTRDEAAAARAAWTPQWLDGYAAGFASASEPDPFADDLPPRGRETVVDDGGGYAAR